jgi:ElaB/YqjD/DUF883 family membrane-anchored ribosome-binding protein
MTIREQADLTSHARRDFIFHIENEGPNMDASTTTTDHSERNHLADRLSTFVTDAEHLLDTAQHKGSEQFAAARERIERQLRRARTDLDSLQDAAGYKLRRAARATDNAVHDHPYAALGLAVGLGVLIGALAARR